MVTQSGMASIDGLVPQRILTPDDPDQTAAILKNAADRRLAVVPLGGGTMLDMGSPLKRADLVVSLERLNRVLDYQPANLTVRAESGITLGALNQALAAEGQFVPLDPPCPDRATLGGILAANASGALRTRYGAARDLLIGIRVALADGQIIRGGGQVVKNVAGYDVPKLFVGSLGTLGIIVEATFKLAPLPKKTVTLLASFADLDHACQVSSRVLKSPLLPLSIEILNAPMSTQFGLGDRPILAVRFAGIESQTTRQLSDVNRWAGESGGLNTERMQEDAALWARLRDWTAENRIVVKLGVLPSQIAEISRTAEEVAARHHLSIALTAHAIGLVFVALDGEDARVAQAITEIGQVANALRGHYALQRGPRTLRESIAAWGPLRSDWEYMRKIKQELDPYEILNPGRI